MRELAAEQFGDMVKAVVDVARAMMALGGAMQADEEAALLEDGSEQADLWGSICTPVSTEPRAG